MDWYRSPTEPMAIEPSVFEAFLRGEEQFLSAPNDKIPELAQSDPVVAEDFVILTAKFLKQIVFHLQHMSAQSTEGLDKMDLLVAKVEQLVL